MCEVKDYPPYLDYPKPYKMKTNADLIRAMSDEELANFLIDFSNNGGWTTEIGRKSCYKTIADYLQQPAEAKHGCDFAKKMGFSSCDKCPIDCDIRQMPESKEFIERGALLARYDAEHVGPPGRARELIATAPAADVVEVVRCRDCKWYSELACGERELLGSQGWCNEVMARPMPSNGFCSFGERKTDG